MTLCQGTAAAAEGLQGIYILLPTSNCAARDSGTGLSGIEGLSCQGFRDWDVRVSGTAGI